MFVDVFEAEIVVEAFVAVAELVVVVTAVVVAETVGLIEFAVVVAMLCNEWNGDSALCLRKD